MVADRNSYHTDARATPFGKKGLTPSKIGIIFRDSHGAAQVRFVNGNKILRIMKSVGLNPGIPEDVYHMIKKAVAIRKHLERNRKDKDGKFRLILVESRIQNAKRTSSELEIRIGAQPLRWSKTL
uniref:Small ribosomal subunit protein uS15 n=1 Tax=Glossina palpalis gambiensis TaxID=67801 RepID=A0A1B0AQY4_9MUSC